MNILVIGGAGYIGSHMVQRLHQAGHKVTTFDNLSNGYRNAVLFGEFVKGDLHNLEDLETLFSRNKFDQVMHFASFIEVGESVVRPDKYYQNNVSNTLNLLNTMLKFNVKQLIFSSTAALFGKPIYTPIDEKHPINPINPYSYSKYMIEQILTDYDHAFAFKSVCLRYFNAAGADEQGKLGERHQPETHLIPLILQTASGVRESISIFGCDYDTPDGTCVRDYIHVQDLCSAHLLASEKLAKEPCSASYNLGNTQGFSVKEVIETAQRVVGENYPIHIIQAERRTGDPATLIADAALAKIELGWRPKYTDLAIIIKHAWQYANKQNSKALLPNSGL